MEQQVNTIDEIQSSAKENVDANGNVVKITIDEGHVKKTHQKPDIIETEDNWIARFLYGGRIGYTVNFSLLIAVTAYLYFSLKEMYNDEEAYRGIIKPYWERSITQFFKLIVPVDTMLCVFVVFTLFPLSCVSRSLRFNWFIGLTLSSVIFVFIWSIRHSADIGSRILLFVDWARLSMKIASFLVECNKDDEVYNKSSMSSLMYFLYAPTLLYKHEYPRARRIRWLKVISHIWWIFGGGYGATYLFIYKYTPYARLDLLTVDFETMVRVALIGGAAISFFYPVVIWFFIFENFCGLNGELLRFPYLKIFGDLPDVLSGRDPLTQFNIIVSKWFARYVYIPVIKSSGSRLKAMWLTMALSVFFHEISFFYISDVIIFISLFLGVIVAPLLLVYQPKGRVWLVVGGLAALGGAGSWTGCYFGEFLAWNYSSMPGVDNMSKFRLIPLFVTQLYQNFEPQLKCYLTNCGKQE